MLFIALFSTLPYIHASALDDSMILKNGYFLLNDEKVFLSSDAEFREFGFSPNIRISGLTSLGFPFYIIENSQTDLVRGFILESDELTRFEYRHSMFSQIAVDNTVKGDVDVNYLVTHHTRVFNGNIFNFSIKTFDKSIYDGNNFDTFIGKLDGVKIQVTITDKQNNILREFSGITQSGIFEQSIRIPDNLWPRGTYYLNLDLEYNGNFYQTNKEFFILGDPPDKGN